MVSELITHNQYSICLSVIINDHIKDPSIPNFMKYTLKILPTACLVFTEMVFFLCPIDVIHYIDSFPNIKSLIPRVVDLMVEENYFRCY